MNNEEKTLKEMQKIIELTIYLMIHVSTVKLTSLIYLFKLLVSKLATSSASRFL